jgi:hypothetical protein
VFRLGGLFCGQKVVMKTSCLNHPSGEPLIIIRRWQIQACEGNACAAALLSFFEYWHNIRIEAAARSEQANAMAEKHGEPAFQDTSLMQYHSTSQLESGILIYSADSIRAALDLLDEAGFVTCHKNPNPRLAFDRTRYFQFQPSKVQAWIDGAARKFGNRATENPSPSPENPESTTKEPSETKTPEPSSSEESGNGTANPRAAEVAAVFEAWSKLDGVPKWRDFSEPRKQKIATRLKNRFFAEHWRTALLKVGASPFCKGQSERGWKADLDWFLKPDSCARIMEGKYDSRDAQPVSGAEFCPGWRNKPESQMTGNEKARYAAS